jgi:hypothetical protein
MEARWKREDAKPSLHHENCKILRLGELIMLVDGSLSGIEGVFAPLDGDKRVMVFAGDFRTREQSDRESRLDQNGGIVLTH